MNSDLIDQYNRQIRTLRNQRQRFLDLIYSLNNSILPALNKSYGNLTSAAVGISNYFTIDGEGIDRKSVIRTKDKIEGIINKITRSVIPDLNSRISSIDGSISYYEYLIRKEREKDDD